MGSRLNDKYNVNHGVDKVAWYIPCMIWVRGEANGRSVGGINYVWYFGFVGGGSVGGVF